ncbi:TetR/AcrR family transcriptional regulator [Amycolatopsis sp. CA-230715]|uniref:TetR/AcrR family transcriptional regulator n=1 Tax=Amycolatopsis sp. CA-230715 TaxID=2745196 RepID=UPI001C02749B|nr:TetR/AcrR family transcriptional regulator [Amycolatopsis sp. CA-230715]
MARPRAITDQRLLDAAVAVTGRIGPGFTLAQVAAEAGVAVGTVSNRFGSKLGLLKALSRGTTERVVAMMRDKAERAADPVTGLRAAAVCVFSWLGDAEEAANHLGQLGVDIGEPELRELLGEHFSAVEGELLRQLRTAELPGAPSPERAARVLVAVVNGISFDWSIRPSGALTDRLTEDIDAVLDGWRRERSGR